MRLLVIEDEADQRASLCRFLEKEGFAVDEAEDLATAEYKWWFTRYDCVVLDRMLHGGDALGRLAEWRAKGCDAPVLILSALGDHQERVAGLDAGADGYLTKGVDPGELADRVTTVCRRATDRPLTMEEWGEPRQRPSRYALWADLEVDLGARELRRGGVRLFLTRTQFTLLEVLLEAGGDVVRHRELIERGWDRNARIDIRGLKVHIKDLRKKLGRPDLIRTVRGEGYALIDPSSA